MYLLVTCLLINKKKNEKPLNFLCPSRQTLFDRKKKRKIIHKCKVKNHLIRTRVDNERCNILVEKLLSKRSGKEKYKLSTTSDQW